MSYSHCNDPYCSKYQQRTKTINGIKDQCDGRGLSIDEVIEDTEGKRDALNKSTDRLIAVIREELIK